MSPLLNYTTSLTVNKTVSQVQKILMAHGAKAIAQQCAQGRITSMFFQIEGPEGDLSIKLPVNAERVHAVLQRQYREGDLRNRAYAQPEHAERVAWRILKDWLEAQMAILESEMVTLPQIFLPYIIGDGGRTLYEVISDRGFLLTEGKGS